MKIRRSNIDKKLVFENKYLAVGKDLKRKVFVYSGQAEISSNIKFQKYI